MNTSMLQRSIRLGYATFFLILLFMVQQSYAQEGNPQQLLAQVTNSTFERIDSEQQMIQADADHLRVIINQELMPYVDYQFAALKVLGAQFRSVPKSKIPEYVNEFREYLVSNFAVVLADYGGQELLFEPAKLSAGQKNMTVKALIRSAGRPDIKINFKLRKTNKTQEWKTYDLVAEGISLLSSKRSEFASVIRQQGIQEVINLMKASNTKPLAIAAKINN